MSQAFDERARSVLNEWIDSGDSDKIIAAASLLEPASSDFVLTQIEFVANLLERAHEAGRDCLHSVQGTLLRCAATRGGSGIAGEPLPHDVAARDRAAEAAGRFPEGTAPRRFYKLVEAEAAESIRRTMERNEEIGG